MLEPSAPLSFYEGYHNLILLDTKFSFFTSPKTGSNMVYLEIKLSLLAIIIAWLFCGSPVTRLQPTWISRTGRCTVFVQHSSSHIGHQCWCLTNEWLTGWWYCFTLIRNQRHEMLEVLSLILHIFIVMIYLIQPKYRTWFYISLYILQ